MMVPPEERGVRPQPRGLRPRGLRALWGNREPSSGIKYYRKDSVMSRSVETLISSNDKHKTVPFVKGCKVKTILSNYAYTIGGPLRLNRGVALGGALLTVEAGDKPPVRDSGV